jgi:hypothetical protein
VADDSEGKAQGHGRRGDQEDNQARWHPGSLQVLLTSQPKTMPTPTSPTSVIIRGPELGIKIK